MREVNINIEGYNVNGICVGCLNYGRKMSYDADIEKCFKLIANINISDGLSVQVCWECLASVRRVLNFQSTILESYNILINYSRQNSIPEVINHRVLLNKRGNIVDLSQRSNSKPHTFLNSPSDLATHAKQRLAICHKVGVGVGIINIKAEDTDNQALEIEIKTEIDDEKKPEFDSNDQQGINYEPENYQDIDSVSFIDHSPLKSDTDDDIKLSKLKEQKKKKSRHKKKTKRNFKNEVTDKLVKKLKNLPEDAVELVVLNEEEMNELRREDVNNYDFTKSKFKCDNCILSFNSERLMADHFTGKHRPKTPQALKCDICQVYLLTKESFKQHRTAHLSVYSCKKCQYKSCSKKLIAVHLDREHATAETVRCKTCGESFGTKSKLNYHKNVCKQEKPQCDCCGKVFANKITLKYHLKVLPASKPDDKDEEKLKKKLVLTCPGCGKIFRSKKSYRAHVVIHDGLQYPCSLCGKQFQWKRNLARHMRNHRDKEAGALHECRQCGKRFSSRDCYNNHMRFSKKHVAEDKLTHECSYCGKKFATKWCMVDHIDWDHLKNIKYQCNSCLKPFKTAKILAAHINNIHGMKSKEPDGQHLCDICGKYYKSVKRLKGHVSAMHTHRSTSKSYKCHFCPATFTWQTSIYKHLKMMHEWPRKDGRNKPRPVPMQPKKELNYPDMQIQPTMQFYPQILNINNSQISINLPSNSVSDLVS